MSSRNNDVGATQSAEKDVAALHQPFTWIHTDKANRSVYFIESVADMCAGLQTCLQLVHSTDLALYARSMDDDEAKPVLDVVDRERLLRLAIAVTGALAQGAYKEIEWVNDQARKAVKEGAR